MSLPTRDEAYALLCEWVQSESLRRHMLAVEASLRAYARHYGEDEELWGITGLLHDLDYERFADMDDQVNGHPRTELRLFQERGYPAELIHAVEAHAVFLGVPCVSLLDKALLACDELTGLIQAAAYVRPDRDLRNVELKSIKKKWKDKAYTAAIDQLVPQRYLGQDNGIVQFGSAPGRLFALFLGGVLIITVGLDGVFIIDFVTFLFAISTLLFIRFPNTLFRTQEEPLIKEIRRGGDYIVKRKGLVAMIVFFALVNFFLSIVTVLSMPLVLAFESAAVLGGVAAMLGAGMLVGGVLMGFWGGAERRMTGMIVFVGVSGLASIIMGLQPSAVYAAVGFFGLGITGALVDAHWRTLIQTKVGLELQGRVLSTNRMMALSTMPLGALAAGPLVDRVFEPLMINETLVASTVGAFIGAGPGRGIALLMITVGLLRIVLALAGYSYKPLRNMEDDLPDAVPDAIIVADKDILQAQADKQLAS